MKTRIEMGPALEARVQRLFMCQGAFAERGLFMRAAAGDAKMVTDIDVVAHDYSINFDHRRLYAECKGGKNASALDRVIWVRGIKEVIEADNAHLVIDHCDLSTARFARSQGIEILQAASIIALEEALRISKDFWPGRSNLRAYAPLEALLKKGPSRPPVESVASWVNRSTEIWRESSALTFSYGRLNALLGLLEECNALPLEPSTRPEDFKVASFSVAALLVRLSQYILFIAADTLAMSARDRLDYLSERLVSGGLDIGQSRQILQGALQMVNAQLQMAGIDVPAGWNIDNMLTPPPYTRPLAAVVERVISDGHRAVMLPLAMEVRQFGFDGQEDGGGNLVNRARFGNDMASLVIGFVRQSLDVPENLTFGMTPLIEGLNPLHARHSNNSGGNNATIRRENIAINPGNTEKKGVGLWLEEPDKKKQSEDTNRKNAT